MTTKDRVRSFSGSHPFDPHCVIRALRKLRKSAATTACPKEHDKTPLARTIVSEVNRHRCPRCLEPLTVTESGAYWRNAGSRTTLCRCIPVCSDCGLHEALEPRFSGATTTLDAWPIDAVRMRRDLDSWRSGSSVVPGTFVGEHVLVPDGVLTPRAQWTGGWRAFGFSDGRSRH